MRVLITGVSGFVGSRLAGHLRKREHEVAGTYIREAPDLTDVKLFEADLLDLEAMERAVEDFQPEVVVHLAGLSHVGESWSRWGEYFRVNALGTENLLRTIAGVRLVTASSAEVYGHVPEEDQPITEDRPLAPQSPYAMTKAAAERLALMQGAVVVRSFNIVGPGQAPNFALPSFAGQLAEIRREERQPVIRVGNLAARRDFVHVDDAVEAYRLLLEQGEPGEAYNLGGGRAYGIGEALERLIAVSGVETEVEVDPDRVRPVEIPLLLADTGRLRALGWSATRTLDDALKDLWETTTGHESARTGSC
ncbi:MAG: GDP-mannose 4,6-dehydratase [Thermoanaerobaculia bacterium]